MQMQMQMAVDVVHRQTGRSKFPELLMTSAQLPRNVLQKNNWIRL